MTHVTLLLIAFGLSMDAFAVSVSNGIAIQRRRANHALRIGLFFGSFQALMPLIGWAAGLNLRDLISGVDHWIAFGLLTFIGCKMIYESKKMNGRGKEAKPLNLPTLLMLSVATSIDALAVGISFALLNISIIAPILVIGAVTFVLSFFGVLTGSKIGHFFEKKIEILGGLILIGIGIKILIEHLN
jgi:putative Mn2+ efflux pump MntP